MECYLVQRSVNGLQIILLDTQIGEITDDFVSQSIIVPLKTASPLNLDTNTLRIDLHGIVQVVLKHMRTS